MNFTQDWFDHNIQHLIKIVANLPSKKRFLEIGCFEGRSTTWFLQNALDDDGLIHCVDLFTVYESQDECFMNNIEEVIKPTQSLSFLRGTSYQGLAQLIMENNPYDFIYVDGSHTAYDTLADACMAWGLLKSGGAMVFDDYLWKPELIDYDRPQMAIDAFLNIYRNQLDVVHRGYQIGVIKK
jgi:predicted O-methyltransferase YrrM